MHGSRRYWPRWVLLALVACGVAGMHALGHPHEAASAAVHSGHHVVLETHADSHASSATEVTGAHVPMGPMCLAILTAALLLLGAGLSVSRCFKALAPRRARTSSTSDARGPPNLVPVGLALTRITVLRI